MTGDELTLPAAALMRVTILLLYAPFCLVALRWLAPRLNATSRLIVLIMLAAQIPIMAMALESRPRWELGGWLWNLDQEWNIPSAYASVQLALVSGAALATATLAKKEPVLNRLYFAGVSLVFLHLAWDEYFALHEINPHWQSHYLALGGALAAATLLVTLRKDKRVRKWHAVFLLGIALSGIGAMIFKGMPTACGDLGLLRLDGCLDYNIWEESAEFIGAWLALAAVLGSLSEAAPARPRLVGCFLFALPLLWTLLLVQDALLPRIELRFRARPAAVQFEMGVNLLGYRAERNQDQLALWLYPSAWRSHYSELGFSLHLVDQASGASIAGRDIHARRQSRLLLAPAYSHVYRQLITIETPPEIPANRALWIALSIWRDAGDEFVSQKALSSDHQLLSETQVVLGELVLPAPRTGSFKPLAVFDGAFTLGEVELPLSARRGQALRIRFSWRADAADSENFVQFLHLKHEESGEWWVYDQQPLGPRLPTRLWYIGLDDSEVWEAPLPADLAPGAYTVYTGLYRLSDQERVMASDADGTAYLDARVPLGSIVIEP